MLAASDRLTAFLCHAAAVADAPAVEAMCSHALDALIEVLGADRGAVALAGDDSGVVHVQAAAGLSPASVAAIEEQPAWPAERARPVIVPDIRGVPEAEVPPGVAAVLEALRLDGAAGAALWPVGDQEGVVGALVAAYNQPGGPDDDERRMGELLATQVASSLERRRSGAPHRLTHAQLRGVLEATGEGIVVRSADGTLLWANAEAAQLLGQSSVEELLATPVNDVADRYEVFDTAGRRVTRESFPGRRVPQSGDQVESVLRYRELATGKEFWALIRAQELRDPSGLPVGSVTVFRDVTARQQALLDRDASEDRLSFLASMGPQLLAASLDYRGVLERVADLVVPKLADYCAIREVTHEGTIRRLTVRHADPGKAELIGKLETYPLDYTQVISDAMLREGRGFLAPEISEEQLRLGARDEEHFGLLRELNPVSVMAVPIQARGRTVGLILLVTAESGRRYGQADLLLVEDLARRAGLAIDNARLYQEEHLARSQAEQTRAEIAFLLDASTVLASSLDFEEGLDRLARLASSSLCDLCLIDLMDHDGGSIRRVAAAAADSEKQPLADLLKQRYAPDPAGDHPAVRVMRSGQPEFSGEMEEAFMLATTRDEEHRRITRELEFRSYISVPLAARGRILGALTLVATPRSGRRYRQQDVALAADLARRAGLALDNARLYQETELQKVLLTTQGEAGIEGVFVVSPEARVVSFNRQLAEMWGIPPALLEGRYADDVLSWMRTLVADPDPFVARVHELRRHREETARDEILLTDGRVFDRWSAPLTTGDGVYHGRAWYFRDVTDLKRAQEERSRLYEAERRAHIEAETSRSRLQFLLEANTLLAGSVEFDAALSSLAALVVDSLADYCAIDVVGDGGAIVRAAAAGRAGAGGDGGGEGGGTALGGSEVLGDDTPARVIRSRRPLLVPDTATSSVGIRGGPGAPPIGSYVAVPLFARSEVLGCLSMAATPGGARQYGPDDLALAQDLGGRVAFALDHARLFNAQRHIAMTLQESLLPPELPAIPGVELAARYRAASAASEVGGDFYDVFPAGEGAWAITLGDISGKGIEAASLTALARYTVRAAAREHRQPREILFQLNEAVMAERPASRFLTIVFCRLRWRASGLRLTVACGGHPPPLLLRAGGTVERAARPGTLIGFLPSPDLPEKVSELKVGDVALFYTDGLTDVRGPSGMFGEERLVSLLGQCRGLGAEEVAARLESEVLAFQRGEPRDDLALVVLRVVEAVS